LIQEWTKQKQEADLSRKFAENVLGPDVASYVFHGYTRTAAVIAALGIAAYLYWRVDNGSRKERRSANKELGVDAFDESWTVDEVESLKIEGTEEAVHAKARGRCILKAHWKHGKGRQLTADEYHNFREKWMRKFGANGRRSWDAWMDVILRTRGSNDRDDLLERVSSDNGDDDGAYEEDQIIRRRLRGARRQEDDVNAGRVAVDEREREREDLEQKHADMDAEDRDNAAASQDRQGPSYARQRNADVERGSRLEPPSKKSGPKSSWSDADDEGFKALMKKLDSVVEATTAIGVRVKALEEKKIVQKGSPGAPATQAVIAPPYPPKGQRNFSRIDESKLCREHTLIGLQVPKSMKKGSPEFAARCAFWDVVRGCAQCMGQQVPVLNGIGGRSRAVEGLDLPVVGQPTFAMGKKLVATHNEPASRSPQVAAAPPESEYSRNGTATATPAKPEVKQQQESLNAKAIRTSVKVPSGTKFQEGERPLVLSSDDGGEQVGVGSGVLVNSTQGACHFVMPYHILTINEVDAVLVDFGAKKLMLEAKKASRQDVKLDMIAWKVPGLAAWPIGNIDAAREVSMLSPVHQALTTGMMMSPNTVDNSTDKGDSGSAYTQCTEATMPRSGKLVGMHIRGSVADHKGTKNAGPNSFILAGEIVKFVSGETN
jgi:hypothetical protein